MQCGMRYEVSDGRYGTLVSIMQCCGSDPARMRFKSFHLQQLCFLFNILIFDSHLNSITEIPNLALKPLPLWIFM